MQDRDGAKRLLPRLEPVNSRLKTIDADGAYAGAFEDFTSYFYEWDVAIVRKLNEQKGFVVLPRRRIVERTLSWIYKNDV